MKTAILSSILTLGLGTSVWAEGTPLDIAVGDSVVVDNFADEDLNSTFGEWMVYPDEGGKTTVTQTFVSNAGVDGASKALRVDFSLDGSGILGYDPYIEFKTTLSKDNSTKDLSNCNEIAYDYRGNVDHYFKVASDIDVASNFHRKWISENSSWKTAKIHWSELNQYEIEWWGIEASINDVQKNMAALMWQVQSNDGTSGYLEIANVRCLHKTAYTVNFYTGTTLLYSGEFLAGDIPAYYGSYSFSNERYDYYINGWTPELSAVSEATSYQAVLDSSVRTYEVEFVDDDGDLLMRQYLEYGQVPAYVGMTPEKLPSSRNTYSFKGWGKRSCEEVEREECENYGKGDYCYNWTEYVCSTEYVENLPPVTESVHYVPVYDTTVNMYTVKFADYDGTVLSEKRYAYGTRPEDIVRPANPTRAPKNDTTFSFRNWIPYVSEVTGNVAYVASYSAKTVVDEQEEDVELYTVAFVNGSEILQTGEYAWGETPEYTGEIPVKESSAKFDYSFYDWQDQEYWYDGIHEVENNAVYEALFDEEYRMYWIVFLHEDGSVIDSLQYEYGDYIDAYDLEDRIPIKSQEDGYGYDEGNWSPAFTRVKGRAVYQLSYSYRVRFVDDAGNEIYEEWLRKGETPDCKYCQPKKTPTLEYVYEFVGWDKEYTPVTDTTTYTAVFMAKPVPAGSIVEIAEGEAWLADDFEDGDEVSKLGTNWYVFDESAAGATANVSEISKVIVNVDGGKALQVSYNRNCGYCNGSIGVGLPLASNGTSLDLSQCNAIQYDYRGVSHRFSIGSVYDENNDHLETYVGQSDDWTTATIYRRSFWNGGERASVAFSHLTQLIWDDMYGEGSLELDNVRCLHKPSYVVKFYDGDNLLDSALFAEGEMPEYNGETDLWSLGYSRSDEQYDYEFAGWSPERAPVSSDVSYQAQFNKSLKTFSICFSIPVSSSGKGYGMNSCQPVEYGKTPVYDGTPTRDADESCGQYEFDNWTSACNWVIEPNVGITYECEKGLFPATETRFYTASFTCKQEIKYTITFKDDEGNVISSGEYAYGEYVSNPYPEKASTEQYEYEFTGWEPEFDSWVHENATYTAQFETHNRKYVVRFEDAWGNTVFVDDEYEIEYPYGTPYSEILLPTDEPEKYSDNDTQYEFAGWDLDQTGDGFVRSNMTIAPKYNNKYAVRFENYDGASLTVNDEYVQFYPEGTPLDEIAVPEDNPTRESGYNYETGENIEYEFAGWLPAMSSDVVLTGPVTVKAAYKSSDNKYTIVFKDGDRVLYQYEASKDSVPVYEGWETPSKYDTEEFTYTWDSEDGWEPELSAVTGPMEYQVKFKETRRQYEVVFVNDDGTELSRKMYDYGATITDVPSQATVLASKSGEYQYSDEWCTMYVWTSYYTYNEETGLPEPVVRRNLECGDPGLKPVTGNVTYAANILYKVNLYNGDGTLLGSGYPGLTGMYNYFGTGWYRYGSTITYLMLTPTKTMTASHTYTWNHNWEPALDTIRGSGNYTALFDSTLRQYAVTFEDEDGTVLKEATYYDYGTPVNSIVLPADPKKDPTETVAYTFAGWSLDRVTEDVTYVATYNESPRMYMVTFVNEDGVSVIDASSYGYGTLASAIVVPSAPAKSGYKFIGWTPEIADVTQTATYKANYVENNKFVVTWRNEDGSLLAQKNYIEGDMPVFDGETPVKESSVQFDYTFDGWSPAVVAVTKDVEYTATYTSATRKYYVKFVNYDETLLDSSVYEYGTSVDDIEIPEAPGRASNENYIYTFAGWNPLIGTVVGDVTYKALYGNIKRTYTVTFKREDGSIWRTEQYYYNEVVSLPGYGPTKETPACYYEFDKWVQVVGNGDVVKSDMEYIATNLSECEERTYDVEFYDPIRERWYDDDYAYGTKADALNVPEVAMDTTIDDCSYHFTGWKPTIVDVTRDAEYTAVYDRVCGEAPVSSSSAEPPASSSSAEPPVVSSSSEVPPVSSSSEPPVVSSSSEVPVVSSSSEPPVVSSSSVVPPVSSSSEPPVVSSSSEVPVVSSSSEPPVVSSSSVVPPVSSSSEPPVVSSSSEVPVVSSSSEPPVVSSSSVVPPVSSSSEPPVSSSSVTPPVSSSSVVPPASSSSVVPPASSSSEPPASSSSEPASSSSVEPPASSSSGGTTSVNIAQNMLKFGYANNLLTVAQSSPAMVRVQVFDMIGHEVLAFYEPVAGSKDFSLASLERGSYTVRVSSKTQTRSARIVVK